MSFGLRSIVTACVWLWLVQFSSAQETPHRQIIVKLVDEANAPIVDALAVAIYTPGELDEYRGDTAASINVPPPPSIVATSDAQGRATLDFPPSDSSQANRAVRIVLWKAGYAMRVVPVARQATVQLYRPFQRPIRILDSGGQPMRDVTVEIAAPNVLVSRPDWQKECVAQTNELGIANLPCHTQGLSVVIRDSHGRNYQARYTYSAMFGPGPSRPPCDLLVFKLPEVGSVHGRVPPGLSDTHKPVVHIKGDQRSLDFELARIEPDEKTEDGQFQLENVQTGEGWCYMFRREPYKADEQLPTQLLVAAPVKVVAGQIAEIQMTSSPAAVVSGKVEVSGKPSDLSDVHVWAVGDGDDPTQPQGYCAKAQCDADGNYRLPLLPGRYYVSSRLVTEQLPLAFNWISESLVIDVGQGAASVTVAPFKITRLKSLPVTVKGISPEHVIDKNQPPMTLSFTPADEGYASGELGMDGIGTATLSEGVTVKEIRFSPDGNGRLYSRMVDTDPGEGFELDFDHQLKGPNTNVAIEGRVVDAQGQPLSGVPVQLTFSFEPVSSSARWTFPIQQRVAARLTSDNEGWVRLVPTQIFSTFTLPVDLQNTELKITFAMIPATGSHEQASQLEVVSSLTQWNQAKVTIPDLVLPQPAAIGLLTGRLVNDQSQPLTSQMVWLSQDGHLRRALTDQRGEFRFPQATAPAWLMTEAGWTLQRITDIGSPVELKASTSTADQTSPSPSPARLPLEERRKLAKTLIDNLAKLPLVRPFVSLPEAGFLDPDKYYQQLLVNQGADQLRLQFINFWSRLEDAKLERLASVMQNGEARAQVLWILARRHPSQAAYERVMEAIPIPGQEDQRLPFLPVMGMEYRGQDALISNVAVELYRLGALEPYRDKLQQFMDKVQEQRDKVSEGREMPMPTSLILCRALLDPQSFAEQVLANLELSSQEIGAQERVGIASSAAMLLRLAPKSIEQLPWSRLAFTDESMFELGRLAPRETLRAMQRDAVRLDMLHWLVLGAMLQPDPEAEQIFKEIHPRLMIEERLRINNLRSSTRSPEFHWVRAAEGVSPALGKQAAWQLAWESLRGGNEETSNSMFSAGPRRESQNLEIAFAIRNYFPELTQEIVAREIPEFLQQLESEARRPFIRGFDTSVASYLAPELVANMWQRVDTQLLAELKNAAGNRQPFSRLNGIITMKISTLKGLLAEDLGGDEAGIGLFNP